MSNRGTAAGGDASAAAAPAQVQHPADQAKACLEVVDISGLSGLGEVLEAVV